MRTINFISTLLFVIPPLFIGVLYMVLGQNDPLYEMFEEPVLLLYAALMPLAVIGILYASQAHGTLAKILKAIALTFVILFCLACLYIVVVSFSELFTAGGGLGLGILYMIGGSITFLIGAVMLVLKAIDRLRLGKTRVV